MSSAEVDIKEGATSVKREAQAQLLTSSRPDHQTLTWSKSLREKIDGKLFMGKAKMTSQ